MAVNRRMGSKSAETRSHLLDVAEAIMREEGYAAVTSRQLAKTAQMSPQIVYYYFETMDALFEALFLRHADYYTQAVEAAAAADEPLLALWDLNADRTRAIVITEFMALANHRKGLSNLISDFGSGYHARQAEIIGAEIERKGLALDGWTPARLAAALENLARCFALGAAFNIEAHIDAHNYFQEWLATLLASAGGQSVAQPR